MPILTALFEDFRYAVRLLIKSPGFTIAALVTLAIGIGANTTVFSIINGALLRPLPFEEPQRIGSFGLQTDQGAQRSMTLAVAKNIHDLTTSYEGVAAQQTASISDDAGNSASVSAVTSQFMKVFRFRAAIGRDFTEDDFKPNATPVAIISHEFWQSRFGGNPNVMGQVLKLPEGVSAVVIIGVLSKEVRSTRDLHEPWSVWIPIDFDRGTTFRTGIQAYARLKAGVSFAQAQAELRTLEKQLLPATAEPSTAHPLVQPMIENFVRSSRAALLIFSGAVFAVLLIVILNLIGLELARLPRLEGEFSLRTALGASRWRLMQLILTKTAILGMAGGTIGVLAAATVHKALLKSLVMVDIPRRSDIVMDGFVLAVGLGLSLVTSLLVGSIPAIRASRLNLRDKMHAVAPTYTAARSMRLLQNALTAGQTALTLTLAVAAGLFLNNLWQLLSADIGFQPKGIVSLQYNLPASYSPQQRITFFEDVLQRLKAQPKVQSIGLTSATPMLGGTYMRVSVPDGATSKDFGIQVQGISSDYFSVMGIPVIAGRNFTEDEIASGAPLAIVSATFATKLWPGQSPLGRTYLDGKVPVSVIGVVKDVQYGFYNNIELRRIGITSAASVTTERITAYRPIPIFLKMDWAPARRAVVLLKTSGNVRGLSAMITSMEPKASVEPGSITANIAQATAQQRFQTIVLGSFGVMALLLAGVGIYSVVAHSVVRRTREIGIRMALGAKTSDTFVQVCRQALVPGLIGMIIGFGISVGIRRVLSSYLSAIGSDDPPTYIAVSAILFVVLFLACSIPARRATKLNPVTALRCE